MNKSQQHLSECCIGPAYAELKQILSIPPPDFQGDVNNAAAVANAALESLRNAGDKQFLFLRTILEIVTPLQQQHPQHSQSHDEILFHCITGCRHVILVKWNSFSELYKRLVRDWFLVLGGTPSTSSNFHRFVRLALFIAAASFWKRQWNEDEVIAQETKLMSVEEQSLFDSIVKSQHQCRYNVPDLRTKDELAEYLDTTMSTMPLSSKETSLDMGAASGFLTVLVGEFAGKSSSNYNMPLEFHKRAHGTFEKDGWLNRSLQMSMKALGHVLSLLCTGNGVSAGMCTLALTVVQLNVDIIGWEFGTDAWDSGGFPHTGSKALLKPPTAWREALIRPDLLSAILRVHSLAVPCTTSSQLCHSLRQLVLLMASISGQIFRSQTERKDFASVLLQGVFGLLNTAMSSPSSESTLLDTLSMVSRLVVNYKMSVLVEVPQIQLLCQALASLGRNLLQENLKECESVNGDPEVTENREFREEALTLLLDGVILLCGDPWLLYSGSHESRRAAKALLASTLGPLYADFVTCRTRMARMEETYLTAHGTELDEVCEEIYAVDLEDEMSSLAILGRLDLRSSLECLSGLFANLVPQIQSLWDVRMGTTTVEDSGLLEESRLVTLYIGHLLTDDNAGETPVIPDEIVSASQYDQGVTDVLVSAIQILQQFAEFQASKIAIHPSDPRLSPLLAKSLVWFLHRWAPAYILPAYSGYSATPSAISEVWAVPDRAQKSVAFILSLVLHYSCFWPQERHIHDVSASLMLSMAKRCTNMRLKMITSQAFQNLVMFHCWTCEIRHSAPPEEFERIVRSKAGNMELDLTMLRGYQRLPYEVKGKLFPGILIACSEPENELSKSLLQNCFQALMDAFHSLITVLSARQLDPDSVDVREMTCLCVALYGGVARSGDMLFSERVPKFLTSSLMQLSGLMEFYAHDLTICEGLLRFFRDYAEQFIAILDPHSCLVLFRSSAELLQKYSAHHCSSSRTIDQSVIEDQKYDDVLCALELLIQIGTKDFMNIGDQADVKSAEVTEMIFLGLQQILPLMSRGLLQYPRLCTQFLSLVGFMLETYAEQVKMLPYDLFSGLLESLLYGMSHHDEGIAKSSLQGIAGIAREHLNNGVLDVHLTNLQNHENLIDKCTRRLLMEVVFQRAIWDLIEPAGMALLPLAAIDIHRFAGVVQRIAQQIPAENQSRMISCFEELLTQEVLEKAASGGYEGRKIRILFKKNFESFCREIHSFMILK